MQPLGNERLTSVGNQFSSLQRLPADDKTPASKAQWRKVLLAQRALVDPALQETESTNIVEAMAVKPGQTVCCYLPCFGEPGSPTLLELLRARNVRVLLPVLPDKPDVLDWAEYVDADALTHARIRGLRHPVGPRLGPQVISTADLVVIPALAVDHSGIRLGRGGGYYDRSLIARAMDAPVVAVVRSHEFVAKLPADEHDRPVTGVIIPEHKTIIDIRKRR